MSDHWKSIAKILGTPGIPESPEPEEDGQQEEKQIPQAQPNDAGEADAEREASDLEAPMAVPVTSLSQTNSDNADAESIDNEGIDWDFNKKPDSQLSKMLGIDSVIPETPDPEAGNPAPLDKNWDSLVSSLGIEETAPPEPKTEPTRSAAPPRSREETKPRRKRQPERKLSFGAGLGIDLGPEADEPETPAIQAKAAADPPEEIYDEVEVIDDVITNSEPDDLLGFTSFKDIDSPEPQTEADVLEQESEPEVHDSDNPQEGSEDRSRRRRGRRGGRRRGRRGERSTTEDGEVVAESEKLVDEDEPEVRRPSFDDDHEDDEEVAEMRRGNRRRRGRRGRGGAGGDAESTDRSGPERARPDRVNPASESREGGSGGRRPRRPVENEESEEAAPRQKNIPSWLETVDMLIQPNLDSRKNKPKARGSRGRSRRRNED